MLEEGRKVTIISAVARRKKVGGRKEGRKVTVISAVPRRLEVEGRKEGNYYVGSSEENRDRIRE